MAQIIDFEEAKKRLRQNKRISSRPKDSTPRGRKRVCHCYKLKDVHAQMSDIFVLVAKALKEIPVIP